MQLEGKFIRIAHDPGDPQITSHCPFCGSGQVTGRSDGTIDCAFCGMNYIVRVQPAFPGMPQQPMGPGALTDIGPEMGPMGGMGMDPMMGMEEGPPGEGMPPGMEGDEGAPPFGEEDDEGEGPPFGDEGDEGEEEGDEGGSPFPPEKKDSGSKPKSDSKPKPKSKKASFDPEDLREDRHDDDHDDDDDDWEPEYEPPAERYGHEGSKGYRTLAGDHLDEARYIRHLAVLHSGSDPRVLAQLRREARDPWQRHIDEADAIRKRSEDHSGAILQGEYDVAHESYKQHGDEGRYADEMGSAWNAHKSRVGEIRQAHRDYLDTISRMRAGRAVARKTATSPDAEIRGGKRQHQWLYPVPGSMEWQPSTGGLEHRAHARRCGACGLEGRAYPGPQGGLTWRYARSTDYQGRPEREHADWSECPGRPA